MSASLQTVSQNKPSFTELTADVQHHLMRLVNQQVDPTQRIKWLYWMRDSLACQNDAEQIVPIEPHWPTNILELMLIGCQQLCDWSLEVILRQELAQRLQHKEHQLTGDTQQLQNCADLICILVKYGRIDLAYEESCHGVLKWPKDERLSNLYSAVCRKRQGHSYQLSDLTDHEIQLTPMGEEHLEAFAWQYADPNVAKLCNLPDFNSDQDWFSWLDESLYSPSDHLFAVIHQEWGFIGSVSLRIKHNLGFFYYWLGRDFQGYGFGPRATDILMHLGQKYHAMSCCYAKVYPHNKPSQRAITKLGFTQLPYSMPENPENELLYYLGPEKSQHRLFAEAQQVFMVAEPHLSLIPWHLDELCCAV